MTTHEMVVEIATTAEITDDAHNEILDRTEQAAIDVLGVEPGEELVVAAGGQR